MQVVELNLATRPFKNDTLPWVALVLGIVLLGYVTWWNVGAWTNHRALLADLEQTQANIEERFRDLEQRQRKAVRGIETYDLPVMALMSTKANEVIRWKSFSWTRLFNQLQEVQPYNVQMTSIHPVFRSDPRGARDAIDDYETVPVSVEGLAKTLTDFTEFERALIFDPHFDYIDVERWSTDEITNETIFRMRFMYDPRVQSEPEPADEQLARDDPSGAQAAQPEDAATTASGEAAQPDGGEATAAIPQVGEPEGVLASDELQKISRRERRGKRAGGRREKGGGEPPVVEDTEPPTAEPAVVEEPADEQAPAPAPPAEAAPEGSAAGARAEDPTTRTDASPRAPWGVEGRRSAGTTDGDDEGGPR